MPEKSPETISLITYLWVIALSLLGGVVSYSQRLAHGKRWNIIEALSVQLAAILSGLMVFFACSWQDINPMLTAMLISLASVNSSQAIRLLTEKVKERVNQL